MVSITVRTETGSGDWARDGIPEDGSRGAGTGGAGTFDECNAKYPCVLRVGDEWWMYYSIGHLVDVRDRRRVRTSLAIHKFR
jgi:hypothetical protein